MGMRSLETLRLTTGRRVLELFNIPLYTAQTPYMVLNHRADRESRIEGFGSLLVWYCRLIELLLDMK